MSDIENPYQSPEAPIIPETSQNSGIPLTDTMLQYLIETSPWLRFIGIIGYIGSGMLCVTGIISTIVMLATSNFIGGFGGYPVWLLPLVYLPFGVLMFFPAHFTFKYGQRIRMYRNTHSNEDLESGFRYSRSYWKFMGILYIIYLAAIPISLIIVTITGVALALNM
jgi:hypothetical protein